MLIIPHEKVKKFMLGLDYEELGTLDILVSYYGRYVYMARIMYERHIACWTCLANQPAIGARVTIYDYRNVRAYVDCAPPPYYLSGVDREYTLHRR